MSLDSQTFELLNATLGLSLLLLILIIARDFKKEFLKKNIKIRIPLAFLGLGILFLSIKELYKYGLFDITPDPIIVELIETLYLILNVAAFFSLLRLKEFEPPRTESQS